MVATLTIVKINKASFTGGFDWQSIPESDIKKLRKYYATDNNNNLTIKRIENLPDIYMYANDNYYYGCPTMLKLQFGGCDGRRGLCFMGTTRAYYDSNTKGQMYVLLITKDLTSWTLRMI